MNGSALHLYTTQPGRKLILKAPMRSRLKLLFFVGSSKAGSFCGFGPEIGNFFEDPLRHSCLLFSCIWLPRVPTNWQPFRQLYRSFLHRFATPCYHTLCTNHQTTHLSTLHAYHFHRPIRYTQKTPNLTIYLVSSQDSILLASAIITGLCTMQRWLAAVQDQHQEICLELQDTQSGTSKPSSRRGSTWGGGVSKLALLVIIRSLT